MISYQYQLFLGHSYQCRYQYQLLKQALININILSIFQISPYQYQYQYQYCNYSLSIFPYQCIVQLCWRELAFVAFRGHNRTRTITCDGSRCDSFIVMHLGVLEYPRYLVNISFAGLEIVHNHYKIEVPIESC